MKAGNDNRVVLLGLDQAPWGVALGHDAAAEHVGGCVGLRDWLGVPDDAATVVVFVPLFYPPDSNIVTHSCHILQTLIFREIITIRVVFQ